MNKQTEKIAIRKITASNIASAEDVVAMEEPLEILLEWSTKTGRMKKNIAVTMRTPGDEELLASGFLYTEGIINSHASIAQIKYNTNSNSILVILKENIFPQLHNAERNFYTTSSCGICGKASIEAVTTVSPHAAEVDSVIISPAVLHALPGLLKDHQSVFEHTGGLHACALFTLAGAFLFLQEDVGRHNALDKVIGSALVKGMVPLREHILLLSGRASFEMVQKAMMAGIKIIAAIGAPSSLAVELANEANITLAGFLRDGRCNLYSGYQRIQL